MCDLGDLESPEAGTGARVSEGIASRSQLWEVQKEPQEISGEHSYSRGVESETLSERLGKSA